MKKPSVSFALTHRIASQVCDIKSEQALRTKIGVLWSQLITMLSA